MLRTPSVRSQLQQTCQVQRRYLQVSVPRQALDHKSDANGNKDLKQEEQPKQKQEKHKKTMKELDDELRAAMEGQAGDGGMAGVELEGGQAVSMKRGVRENMFRYI